MRDRFTPRPAWMPAAAAAAILALAAAAPASADWQTVGGGPIAESTKPLSGKPHHQDRYYDLKRIGGKLYAAWTDPDGANWTVHVARLADDGDSWIPVGGVVNADPSHDAAVPSLAEGPGGVPWVAWSEGDADGAGQIRVAHLNEAGDDWVEPDGRDWSINYIPPDFYADRPAGDRKIFSGWGPRLAFLGGRPYVAYLQNYFDDFEVDVVRLADDGHSWERLLRHGGIARNADISVIGGLVHSAYNETFSSAYVLRLGLDGQWEELGGGPPSVDPDGYGPLFGAFERLAGFNDEPYVLWDGYVSHLVNGEWQLAGGGPLGANARGTGLRSIGGRLWAAWADRGENYAGPPWPLHVSYLSDDGSSWIEAPPIAGAVADTEATLSSLDGVPYVMSEKTDGTTNRLVVERLEGAPAPLAPDESEGSGPGEDPDVDADPIVPPDDEPVVPPDDEPVVPPDDESPPPAPTEPCATEMLGTPLSDRLVAGSRSATIRGRAGEDRELGSALRDCLFGDNGSDVLRGRDGEDQLSGGPGADQLFGGPQADELWGGPGPDLLSGGKGFDVLRGGRGNDTILAADGRGEKIWCGRGVDTARVDRADSPHGCEHVERVRKR